MKDLTILAETADFIAINKPSGLLSIPDRFDDKADSALSILRKKYNEVFVVHRLDKLTSGVLLFARTTSMHKYLSSLFENRRMGKVYTGIVIGRPSESTGTIDAPIAENIHKPGEMVVAKRGKPAMTGYKVVESFNQYSVVNFIPLTGRTHQIRVHAKYINHPLACDPVYGDGKPVFLSSFKRNYHLGKDVLEERPLLSRLALHASSLSFAGTNGKAYLIDAALPRDMYAVIQQLKKSFSGSSRT